MKTLQSLLEKTVGDHVIEVAVQLIERKLEQKHVKLSTRQRRRLKEALSVSDGDQLRLSAGRLWQRGSVEIESTEADTAVLESGFGAIGKILPELIDTVSSDLSGDVLRTLKDRWPQQVRFEDRIAREFRKRLNRSWREPISLLRILITISAEFGSTTAERLRSEGSLSELTSLLFRLHARACQVASEVLVLLEGGFPDGAMARWRTLHEIAVVAMLLSEGDDGLAERYRLHNVIESRRAAHEYMKHFKSLRQEPYTAEEISRLDQSASDLITRFGKSYGEPLGWAAAYVGKSSPTFADLEQKVGVGHLRPYYRFASHPVHANPKGVFFKLGLLDEVDLLLTGPSNFGLADPGQNTAISMVHVIVALAMSTLTFDGLVFMKLALRLSDEIGESFVRVQQEIEDDERGRS